jgi:hypothetical protein
VSGQFGVPNQYKLTDDGDVYFTSGGNTGLFRWSKAAGIRRLLQTNDLLTTMLPNLLEPEASSPLDVTGALLQARAGSVAFTISAAIKGREDPGTPVIYDGSSFRLPNVSVKTFSELLVNASGRVAVSGIPQYWAPAGSMQIEVETAAGGRGVVVAAHNQPAPGTGGGRFLEFTQLIGFNDAGQVAFRAAIMGGNTNNAIFLFDGTEVRLVAKQGSANGDFQNLAPATPTNGSVNFALNNNGKVAIRGIVRGEGFGIWIADTSGVYKKLMRAGEDTGIQELGPCSGFPWLRGFDDSDRVLYDCDTSRGPRHALFLKGLTDAVPQVVAKRGQAVGPGGTFDTIQQASLNNAGNVAFLATLKGGSSPMGWFLGAGDADPVKIAMEGESAPAGGKFGLAGRTSPAVINTSGQVLFLADLLDLNAAGLFSWTSGDGVTVVVSTKDSLPDGANTVLRAELSSTSDTESLVRVSKAGGQATFYAKRLETGESGIRKIVADFDQVPKLGTVVGPESFAMNNKGEVVFTAALLGAGSYPLGGILASFPDGGLKRAVLTGDGVEGEGTITSFGASQLNNQSQVAFFADTTVGTSASQAIFLASLEPPSLQKIARMGDGFLNLDSRLALNDGGQVAFMGTNSNINRKGIFIGSAGGAPLKVVDESDPAPRGTFGFSGIPTPFKLNAAGQLAFAANYDSSQGRGIFLGSTTAPPQAIATSGSVAPGTGGLTFRLFSSEALDLNSSGQVAFYADVSSTSILRGWFAGSAAASLSPRLLFGQPLPGGGQANLSSPGARFAALADTGEMAIYVPFVMNPSQGSRIVIAGADGRLRNFAIAAETAEGTGSVFAKLYPALVATPSGRFLFSAMLVDGPAQAGVFKNEP